MTPAIDDEMRRFLAAIVYREHDFPAATREQDRARTKCKRLGLAYWSGIRQGRTAGWTITDAGRVALARDAESRGDPCDDVTST